MVYGAAAAGMRVMTSTSGPGLSLMQEGLSYIAGSEVPVVIVDVMRGGPGLGNIQPIMTAITTTSLSSPKSIVDKGASDPPK